jgi:hypothetical protein
MPNLGAELIAAWLAGLAGSVHCLAMCGGIAGALGLATRAHAERVGRSWHYPMLYNSGRILSYAIAGALCGGAGLALKAIAPALAIHVAMQVAMALMLCVVAWGLLWRGRAPAWIARVGLSVWRRLSPLTRRLLPVNTPARAVAAGMLWGWLPCGLAYAMLIGAWLSASPLTGAALMAAFGLGTAPTLVLSAGVLQALFARAALRRVAAAGMLMIGVAGVLAPWFGTHVGGGLLKTLAACLPGYTR